MAACVVAATIAIDAAQEERSSDDVELEAVSASTVQPLPPSIDTVAVPPGLSRLEPPVEMLAIGEGGALFTVSLPSGRVQVVDLTHRFGDRDMSGTALVVAPDHALIGSNGDLVLVDRDGRVEPFEVSIPDIRGDPTPVGWHVTPDGVATFLLQSMLRTSDSMLVRVDERGVVIDDVRDEWVPSWDEIITADGARVFDDGGTVFEVDEHGEALHVADGELIAASVNHVLVRSCDSTRRCNFKLVDRSSGDQRPVNLGAVGNDVRWSPRSPVRIAPGGDRIAVRIPVGRGAELAIVDLRTGQVSVHDAARSPRDVRWLPDGSGVIHVNPDGDGLQVIDVDGGATVVGTELGAIVRFESRLPLTDRDP